jgi:hypothetical protein
VEHVLSKYRRTPPPAARPAPGRLPTGRRLAVIAVGLVLLAVLAVVTVTVGGGDDDEAATTTTSTTASSTPVTGGRAPDSVLARLVLPATLGSEWLENSRQAEPEQASVNDDDPCASAGQPVPDGLVVQATFDRLRGQQLAERAALVAGIVTEGTPVPRLDDPAVVECLRAGLAEQTADGNEVVPGALELDAPAGAELTAARFEVVEPDGTSAGRFDLVLLRRDRAVSFALVAVLDATDATPLEEIVAALDEPLAAVEPRLN